MSDAEGCGNRCQLSDRLAEIATLRAENSTIKSVLSLVPGKCLYCGLEDIAKCPSGFPGCARADDMLCGEDEASRRLIEERDALRADNQRAWNKCAELEIERDTMRGQRWELGVQVGRLEIECDTLRADQAPEPDCFATIDCFEAKKAIAWLWQHSETGRTCVKLPNELIEADTWSLVGPLYLAPPDAAQIRAERDTLRELVQEALELPVITASWRRSAEKALKST